MKWILFVLAIALTSPVSAGLFGKSKEKKEKEEAAQNDIAMGIQGLQEAAQNPALLAQLQKDMADPEMMEAAKEMMESKEFKKQMKKFQKSPEFKKAQQYAKEAMEDPKTAARLEANMERMMSDGARQLEGMESTINEAMKQMQSNPAVMREMQQMLNNPAALAEMMNDPSVKAYTQQMKEMMEQDPKAKQEMEKLAKQFARGAAKDL